MAEEPSALIVIETATLPQNIKTKAAKFLLRFIAGTFGHEALQAAQEGLDTIAGRTKVAMALATAVAAEAVTDPQELARARVRFLGEAYRKQENVEAIAKFAAEEIANDPTDPPQEPEDDWLNVFTRYAEDASSERVRRLWGRVLAGEYRTPGSVGLRTLRLLAELDQRTAEDFEQVAGLITGDFIYRSESDNQGDPLVRLMRLETAGLVSLGGGFLSRAFTGDGSLTLVALGDDLSLAGVLPDGTNVSIPCADLTEGGLELARLIRNPVTTRAALLRLVEFLKPHCSTLFLGQVVSPGKLERMEQVHPALHFGPSRFSA
ncbi:MAG: hypothetical protein QOJ91_3065 [Sphingomonadales bacterium]|jgi:hypothetical protein|nr:hypothetical protein [Sphingomonadales bacterium]